MRSTAAYKYLSPYISEIIIDEVSKYKFSSEIFDVFIDVILEVWEEIIKYTYVLNILTKKTIEKYSIIICDMLYEIFEYFSYHPLNILREEIIPIYMDVYYKIYDFIIKWGIKYEHYEFLSNLKELHIELKNKMNVRI